ncbi:unnamed protein product [Brachionus calyciflorus]|uniref:LITAF domain-containing protein n=1 Tax=Brachionus calyciflorus TaxID=104777 RepID=A0A814SE30_9BILA|nr:unnamed protein product [Brachionus calyciflorus]
MNSGKLKKERSDLLQANTDDGYTGESTRIGYKAKDRLSEPTASNQIFIQSQSHISVVQPSANVPYGLRDYSFQTVCPSCRIYVSTDVKYVTGPITWLAASAFCVFGLCCGCCLIPFHVDSCKNVEHYCPNCKFLIMRRIKI